MVALASIVLHNMLREKSKYSYTPGSFADEIIYDGEINNGNWRNQIMENMNLHSLPATLVRRSSQSAVKIRQMFTEYFFFCRWNFRFSNRLAALSINFAIRSEFSFGLFSVRAVLKARMGVAKGAELPSDLLLSALLLLLDVKLDIAGFVHQGIPSHFVHITFSSATIL